MPVKMGTADKQLENAIMRKIQGQSYFRNIQKVLQEQNAKDNPVPQRCSVEMMKRITVVLQEELGKKQFQDASTVISAIQYAAHFPDYPAGLPVLLSNGLMNLLAYVLDETQKFVSHFDGTHENTSADSLMEVILETINAVADFNEDAKKQAVGVFTENLMKLIVGKKKTFHVRMEAIRTLNLLLEGCLDEVIQIVRNYLPNLKLMGSMADLLATAGDFEMQVACTESLARLVKRSDKSNYEIIRDWFSDSDFATAFMEIRDETFETDCRKFLNHVNECLGSKRSVYSLPCLSAHLGSYKLMRPVDINLNDFWVDFNTVSSRITLYVAEEPQKEDDEGGMWDTVTIRKEAVEKFHLSERGERQTLFITLNVPATELLAFCPSDDRHTHIAFDASLDVYSAAISVFGQEKLRRSKHKTSVSQINIPVHLDDSVDSPGPMRNVRSTDESSDTVSIQNANIYGLGGAVGEEPLETPKTPRSVSTRTDVRNGTSSTRRKISIPLGLMITPTTLLAASSHSACGSLRSGSTVESESTALHSGISVKPLHKKSDFAQPKTPAKPNSSSAKRVKTPLQIVVSDKATDSGNESVVSCPSISKKASISSGVSVSSCGTPTRLRQKLQQAAAAQHHLETSGLQNGTLEAEWRSDSGLASDVIKQARTRHQPNNTGLQNGCHDQIDGHRSDPGQVSNNKSLPLQKRQLRARINKPGPPKSRSAKHHDLELQENGSGWEGEGKVSSVGAKESKAKGVSKKFRLYSDNGAMMMETGESSSEVIDTDMVIPSSVPTQESVVDVIPDSLPPSGQSQLDKPEKSMSLYSRIKGTPGIISQCYPVAHSPSLSALTEESTLSKGSRTMTSITSDGERAKTKANMWQLEKIIPVNLQEQVIEEELSEKRVLRSQQDSKSVKGDCAEYYPDDREDSGRQQEKKKAGATFKDRSGKENGEKDSGRTGKISDHEDIIVIVEEGDPTDLPSEGKTTSKSGWKGSRREKDQDTDATKETAKSSSKDDKSKRLPPSRAFRKVPLVTPESSQELSQLEFTSHMEARPKRGRPKKATQKVDKGRRQPKKRGAKEQLTVDNPGPRARKQRAAAKAAEREKLSLEQSIDASSGVSCGPTSQFESTDSTDDIKKLKGRNKITKGAQAHVSKTPPKLPRPKERKPSPKSSQDSQDMSVYDFVDLDAEKSQSSEASASKLLSSAAKRVSSAKRMDRLLMSTQDTQDLSVYDFVDSESCKESVKQWPRGKKKPSRPAKTAKNAGAQRRVLAKNSKRGKRQPQSPKELSDIEKSRTASSQRRQRLQRKRYAESPQQPSVADVQANNLVHYDPRKNAEKPLDSPEELSDIEQPRDAAHKKMGSLPRNAQHSRREADDVDLYRDEDVCSFVECITERQRRFLEKEFSRKRTAEALNELISESRKSRQEIQHSELRASKKLAQSSTTSEHQEQLNKTPVVSSTQRRQKKVRDLSSSRIPAEQISCSKSPTRSERSLGVEIIEDESEEVANREDVVSVSSNDGEVTETVSVENFSKMCQSMIKKSGRGLAATRAHRNIPKINYRCQDSEPESSEEEGRELKQDDERVSSGDLSLHSDKRRLDSDAFSERSWLTEKPKRKVSTYSKTHKKEWVWHASIINLDTTVKKKPRRNKTVKRRQEMPPSVQKKKRKKTPKNVQDADDEDVDSPDMCMYYYREEQARISSSQSRQQVAEKTHSDKSLRSAKSVPQVTSTPTAVTQSQQSSLEDTGESSIEVARDDRSGVDDDNVYPLTPLVLDEEIVGLKALADLVTPKALMNPLSISSRCTSSSGKTPKQVTFDSDPDFAEDLSPVLQNEIPKSGPSSWIRPSSSMLKRKYGDLFSDEGEENDEKDEIDQETVEILDEAPPSGPVPHTGQGALRPKKLFKGAISSPDSQEEEWENEDGDNINDEVQSPPPSHSPRSLPSMQISHMLKAVGDNLKRKMRTKQTQAHQLTEGAVKTTQRQVSKLWSQQLQARCKAQEEFKHNLLTEVVALETDLSHLHDSYAKMQALLEQHRRKTTSTLLQHVQQVKSLFSQHQADARELNDQLGRHLQHSVKQILAQEMAGMQKKLVQDAQHHELQQMKKGLQTMLML